MWGNAFADLAKKAQDLQEQAKEQASHIAVRLLLVKILVCLVVVSSNTHTHTLYHHFSYYDIGTIHFQFGRHAR